MLSNQRLRTIFEEYGDDGLRLGIKGPDGIYRGGYQYQGNCYEIFDKFFLENNPYSDLCTDMTDTSGNNEIEGSYFGTSYRGLSQPPPKLAEDINLTVDVTLEEMYNGARKEVSYKKQVLGLDGRSIIKKDSCVTIFIKPGMLASHKMTINGAGNQQPKLPATKLNLSFKQVASEAGSNSNRFERKGTDDLIYRHKVSL